MLQTLQKNVDFSKLLASPVQVQAAARTLNLGSQKVSSSLLRSFFLPQAMPPYRRGQGLGLFHFKVHKNAKSITNSDK